MNKDTLFSIAVVVLLSSGLLWFVSQTTPEDAQTPTPTVSSSPRPSGTPLPLITGQGSIILTSPRNGDVVGSPILVTGQSRAFENQFMVQLQDGTGKIVYQTGIMSDAKDAGEWGNYKVYIPIPAGMGQDFKVEAIEYSTKGCGSLGGYGSADIKLKSTETDTINVAFVTSVNPDCNVTKMFSRTIIKTESVGVASLLELLKGPTSS